ncbi:uncharacterized protein MEPE_01872 [Melanopsichium pennsylvanicum]|uniref:Bud22 domain-containing protein n=2 Tax=Melanopsichium pennsylvanicum TaxID=63383 RepID=A0AAJ4XJL1_9BASI|nr:conserved hypothetical protein [Melanopsichium pennsylvanicum 4]SNX83166.1 uncharacterized protein MEPE_01872 [Melanopsichium pennsylvanicum]
MGSKSTLGRRQQSPLTPSSDESSSSSTSEASSSRASPKDHEQASATDVHGNEASNTSSDIDFDTDNDVEDGGSESVTFSILSEPRIDLAKAKSKLHHIAKTLRSTAKKAKTFEVQKQVKKLKGLQKKCSPSSQTSLAEAELAALKSIDSNVLAGRALVTKMVKAKLLPKASGNEEDCLYLRMVNDEKLLGEEVLTDLKIVSEGDRAAERARARISSSKVLADEVGKFVEELKRLAGFETAKSQELAADVKGRGKSQDDMNDGHGDEREYSGSEEEEEGESDDDNSPRRQPLVDTDEDEDEQAEAEVDEEELMRIGKEKMKALGDLSQWDDMVASDSGAEFESESKFESESDSEGDEEEAPIRQYKSRTHESYDSDSNSDDISDDDSSVADSEDYTSDSVSDSESDSEFSSSSSSSSTTSQGRARKRKASTSKSSKMSKKSKSTTTSSFLPSLATGFVPGRSDDEWSDAEAELADRDLSELRSGSKKERKNRMGQRARKALYEKKYGKNANHIKMREKAKAAKAERRTSNFAPNRGGENGVTGGRRQRPPAFQAPTKRDGGWGGTVAPLPKQDKRNFIPRPAPSPAPVHARIAAPAAAAAAAAVKGGKGKAGSEKSQEMHPSWIAKQKQKELLASVKPQGKKVVFD